MKQTKLNILSALLLLIAVGLGQSAQATTKTVTYTITSVESNSSLNGYNIVFTRSGDAPFDASASTYTTSVPSSSIGQTTGGSGVFSVTLADGFELELQWPSGSDVRFTNNCIRPWANNKYITYTVSCPNTNYYYVTHVMMTGPESGYEHGMIQTYPGSGSIDTDYDSVWNFSQEYYSAYSFGQLTVTYTDVPALSIFESAGENTYNIKSKDDLRHLANYVNNGHNDCNGLTFLQTTNITCDNTYTPIGCGTSTEEFFFRGTYDGQGNQISDITVNRTGNSPADERIGIFGLVNTGGIVKNVVLASSTFTGYDYIGGIVGYNLGTVQNCRVESNVTIKAGRNYADYHGGIAGRNDGSNATIIGCISAANVSNNDKSNCVDYGGIVGQNAGGTVKDCLYAGTTVTADSNKGAIVGYKDGGTLTNNYYTTINLGGVSGSDADGARLVRTVTLSTNVALVGNETAYNLSGITAIGTTALRYNNTLYSGATQTLTLSYSGDALATGYASIFSVNETPIVRNTFEVPASNITLTVAVADVWGVSNTPAANGSAEYPYLISSTYALDLLAKNVNGTDGYTANEFDGKHFLQTASLTYDGTENNYTAIGNGNNSHSFKGHYNGDGKTISGINIKKTGTTNSDSDQGLFGYVGPGGNIENLTLAGSTIAGYRNVGGIAGYLRGTVQNCRVDDVIITTGGQNASNNHGGIAGFASGTVKGCLCAATVKSDGFGNNQSFGGIVGYASHPVIQDNLYIGTLGPLPSQGNGSIIGNGFLGTTENNYYTATGNVPGGFNGSDPTQNTEVFACRAITLILGENVAISGDVTTYNCSGLTATGNVVLSYNDGSTTTLYSGNRQTLTLSYTGTVPEGFTVVFSFTAVFSATGGILSGNTLTMPASDVTVSGGAYKNDYVTHWQASPDHDGSSEEKSYIITTPAGLQLLSSETNDDNTFINTFFKLGGDIDMSSVENFTPIGINSTRPFNGTFDGRNHIISHLTINYTSNNNANNAGLFGCLSGNNPFPVICNLTLDRANISGKKYVGGIVGYQSFGTVSNCHVVNSTIRGTDTTPRVGAIVGHYYSTSYNSLSGSNYHSTLVYANSNVKAFNIGCGDWGTSSNQGGDSGSTCLDATRYFLDGSRTDLNELMAAYDDPANYTAYDGTAPDLNNLTATVIGNVTIPSGIVLKAQTVTIATGGRLTLADGAELICNNSVANVIVQKNIAPYTTDKNGWNLITMPYTSNVNPTLICNLVPSDLNSTSYDLYRLHTPTTIWENYKQHHEESDYFFIGKEKACLYARNANVTLQIDPLTQTETIPYTEEGDAAFLTQSGDNWNLIGNPYTFKAYANRPFYRMNATGTALELVENYWQVPINVCEGIVVQTNNVPYFDSCNFTRTAPVPPTSGSKGGLQMTLSKANTRGNTVIDKAVVSFNEDQLGKFYFGEQDANIYLPQDGKDYAIVSAEGHGEMPVCFKARQNGSYTILVNPDHVELNYMHLIDHLTGADIDLLQTPSYTFTAKTTDYASRFKLVFSANENDNENEDFAFISNGKIIVNGTGTLQVIDMLGRILLTQELPTANCQLSTANSPGVYVLKLINRENTKTQKIIIK